MQGPVHAVLPFPDPRKPQPDLSASQALHPVPGTLLASRAVSASLRSPKQPPQAAAEEEQGDDAAELGGASRGDTNAVLNCPVAPYKDPMHCVYYAKIVPAPYYVCRCCYCSGAAKSPRKALSNWSLVQTVQALSCAIKWLTACA